MHITRIPTLFQWILLFFPSALTAIAITALHLPAGWLLGPMMVGIIMAIIGLRLTIPKFCSQLSQALMGCLIAQSLTRQIIRELGRQWPLFVIVILCVMGLSWGLGLILARLHVIPAKEAIWGSSPGAAGAMVIMARAFDADDRLVALMQYTRVVLVVLAASIVTSIWLGGGGEPKGGLFDGWAQFPDRTGLVSLLLLAGIGVVFGYTRIPAASMLVPMFLGVVVNVGGGVTITMPQPLAVFSYLIIGWEVGLRFDREILTSSLRVLPRIFISNLLLILLCGGLGFAVSHLFNIDPVSAYLASSPGGANTIAIIAMTTPVDVPFIMALQVCRMVSIMLLGPVIARALAKRVER
ncbi:membrane protein AbrB duplication [Sediminispirochaeta smaragdinae DSM 11293]|uniref:Membrane protein AbrB duplication n=1 Tax=Sediminispirochaeta smaragdinae (strain DSM 11293 / JCM 15392 / SEBR 4228) TaxID=573413 RepID=E1R785_SEDSS|nr:membrane protein AbrB duplication [Sediminispirochaeta smaragdinae DSM 11293]